MKTDKGGDSCRDMSGGRNEGVCLKEVKDSCNGML